MTCCTGFDRGGKSAPVEKSGVGCCISPARTEVHRVSTHDTRSFLLFITFNSSFQSPANMQQCIDGNMRSKAEVE